MKRFALTICLAACLMIALGSVAFAANSFVVESKSAYEGAGTDVGVFMSNDVSIRQIIVPLAIRAVSTYPSAITASYNPAGRIPEPGPALDGTSFLNYTDVEDGNCKQGLPGGFNAGISNATTQSYTVPSPSDPDAILFARGIIIGGALAAGDDGATPSMVIRVTCPNGVADGSTFTIDTTCTDPANHLLMVDAGTSLNVGPSFTASTITCLQNQCPVPVAGDINATVGTPASNDVDATDDEGDSYQFFLVSGPGSVMLTAACGATPRHAATCPVLTSPSKPATRAKVHVLATP
jgi:hypothetical protein